MLVLTRKCSEMIQIGDDIRIKVIRTGRNSVKIGIEAPNDVRVLRAELCPEEGSETSVKVAPEENSEVRPFRPTVLAISDQFPHVI